MEQVPWFLSLSDDVYEFVVSLLWIVFAFVVLLAVLTKLPIRDLAVGLVGRMTEVKVGKVEVSFVAAKMQQAADQAGSNNVIRVESTVKKGLVISEADRARAVARGQRLSGLMKGRRVLWVDDEVTNNRLERLMLEAFGMTIEQVQDNGSAFKTLAVGGHDLILSDIARGKDAEGRDIPGGTEFIAEYRKTPAPLPVIFYVSVLDAERPLPLGAFGLTNRPDELLHLVLDALERRA